MAEIAERITFAVETLKIQPDHEILEIGCGHGVAVDLICQKLTTGRITAIDRSEKMIEAARKRNKAHIDTKKAVFEAVSLEEAKFGKARFNTVFAINVSLFWMQPPSTLEIVKHVLAPDGLLYIVHQPPVEEKTREVADQLKASLPQYGFVVRDILFKDTTPAQITCVIAVPAE